MKLHRVRSALPKLRAALVGVLALALLSFGLGFGLAPQLATASDDGIAALLAAGAICSSDAGHTDSNGPQNRPPGHQHAHCVLCQAGVAPFTLAGTLALNVPTASVRLPSAPSFRVARAPSFPLPYASRAPPMIG